MDVKIGDWLVDLEAVQLVQVVATYGDCFEVSAWWLPENEMRTAGQVRIATREEIGYEGC